jgi:hypothetical protein
MSGRYNGKISDLSNAGTYETDMRFTYGANIASDLSNFTSAKAALDNKYNTFRSTNNVPENLKSNLAAYIKSGGINTQSSDDQQNPLYRNLFNSWTNTKIMLNGYQNLSQAMADALKSYNGLSPSESRSITNIANLNLNIEKLNKELQQSQTELDIATSRQESIENASTDQSYIQGFSGYIGFTRPLKPTSVALLMGLGFFIFFVTCLILKDYFTTSSDIASQFFSLNQMMETLSTHTSRSVMIGIVITFILYAAGLYVYFYVYP